MRRSPDGGPIDAGRYVKARALAGNLPQYSSSRGRVLPSLNQLASGIGLDNPDVLATWEPVGPHVGGRTRVLVPRDQDQAQTLYLGASGGGVWKSLDQGGSWTYTTSPTAGPEHELLSLSVNALAVIPGADPGSDRVIAGTGEGYFGFDHVRGTGIQYSTDGGSTWNLPEYAGVQSYNLYYINKIVVSPQAGQQPGSTYVYAATSSGYDPSNPSITGGAILRSSDGGASWTKIWDTSSLGQVLGGVMDLAIRYFDDNGGPRDQIFASIGTYSPYLERLETPPDLFASRIYSTSDARAATPSWTERDFGVQGLDRSRTARISLAIAPNSPNIVYALVSQYDPSDPDTKVKYGLWAVLFMNTSSSWNWMKKCSALDPMEKHLLSNRCGSGTAVDEGQGWYNNVIAVDPGGYWCLFLGGVDVYRGTASGSAGSWTKVSSWSYFARQFFYAHEDVHAFVIPTSGSRILMGGDGGVYRSEDRAAPGFPLLNPNPSVTPTPICGPGLPPAPTPIFDWVGRNTDLQVAQFYSGRSFPNGTTLTGGTQDTGTLQKTGSGPGDWQEETDALRGDGGPVAISNSDVGRRYFARTHRSLLRRNPDGTYQEVAATLPPGIPEYDTDFLFIAPLAMDTFNHDVIWRAGIRPWRSTNAGGSWAMAGPLFANPGTDSVSAIALASTDSSYVLMGMNSGTLWFTSEGQTSTDVSGSWKLMTPWGSDRVYVSAVAFDPNDKKIAYAAVSTFDKPHLVRTLDITASPAVWDVLFGQAGEEVENVPVNAVAIDPVDSRRIYLGTDLGVYTSTDWGITWMLENTGFGAVEVNELVITQACPERRLIAFTHGRGAWQTTLPLATTLNPTTCQVTPTPSSSSLLSLRQHGAESGAGPRLCPPATPAPNDVRPVYRALERQLATFLQGGVPTTPTPVPTYVCPQRTPPIYKEQTVEDGTEFDGGTSTVTFPFAGLPSNLASVTVVKQGDLDLNEVVDVNDAIALQNFLAGNFGPGVAPFKGNLAQANGNLDTGVDIFDVVLLQGYIVGNVTCLTPALQSCGGGRAPTALEAVGAGARLLTQLQSAGGGKTVVSVGLDVSSDGTGEGTGLGGYLVALEFPPDGVSFESVTPGTGAFGDVVTTRPTLANATGVVRVVAAHGQLEGPSGILHLFDATFVVSDPKARIVTRMEGLARAVRRNADGTGYVGPMKPR